MQVRDFRTYTPGPLFTSAFEQRVVFFLVFMGVLSLTYGFLFVIDFLPETPKDTSVMPALMTATTTPTTPTTSVPLKTPGETTSPSTLSTPSAPSSHDQLIASPSHTSSIDPYPNEIIFDTLDHKSVKVLNPNSRSITALDNALLSGVVRHPDSASFVNTGTIFLLGHSSYLPVVHNKNFQAFNGIQKLAWGDTVRLRSTDTEYVYRVDRVYQAKAEDSEVKIVTGTPKLTLATCNSFGAKDDRFVVEATLVEQHSLKSE